jgi:O-antigen/teichoic acid export membrane protein
MIVSNFVNTVFRLGMIALLARVYAREEFGVWVAITSMTAVLVTSDFGIGNALRNKLAWLAAKGEKGNDDAREYFLSVLYCFLLAAIVLSIGVVIGGRFVPLQMLFRTSNVVLRLAGAEILTVAQVIFLLGIPLGLGPVMFFAYQETNWSAAFGVAYGLSGAVVVFGLALIGQSIVSTAIGYFLAGLVVTTIGTVVFLIRRRWNPLRVTPRLILPRVWGLLSLGLRFAAIQVSGAFIYNAATLVTSATIGVGDAAEYNLVQKLYTFAIGLYLGLYNPLWSAYADAAHRDDWNWCERTLKRTLVLTAVIFGGFAVFVTMFGNSLLKVMAGGQYISQRLLFALLGLWALCHILWSCVMAFLTAVERINMMAILTVICAGLFVPIGGILGKRLGIVGIAVASVVVLAPLAILGHITAFRVVRRARLRPRIRETMEGCGKA